MITTIIILLVLGTVSISASMAYFTSNADDYFVKLYQDTAYELESKKNDMRQQECNIEDLTEALKAKDVIIGELNKKNTALENTLFVSGSGTDYHSKKDTAELTIYRLDRQLRRLTKQFAEYVASKNQKKSSWTKADDSEHHDLWSSVTKVKPTNTKKDWMKEMEEGYKDFYGKPENAHLLKAIATEDFVTPSHFNPTKPWPRSTKSKTWTEHE